MSLERFVDLTSAGAARIFSIAGKGRIARGFDADFTIVDLKAKKTDREFLDRVQMRMDAVRRHGDDRLGAWPRSSVDRRSCATARSTLASKGQPIRFGETLEA